MGVASEPLGMREREREIDEQSDDHDPAENIVQQHRGALQVFAQEGVSEQGREPRHTEHKEGDIQHR
jgi:hypothetical protein